MSHLQNGFSPDQVSRYARHLILPEVSGVGHIGILDFDVVDKSNLQRQILHGVSDVGRPKVDSAADALRDINPDVEVVQHQIHINSENALEVFRPYDIIVDGTDN